MSETKDDSQPEAKDESKAEAKSETQTESKDEPMPVVTDETKPEAEDETETKGGNKPEEDAKIPSSVSPDVVKRVHEFYEELGREDVRAVMDMEKTEQEIPKPETKAEAHPVTKSEPKVKDELKPETKADTTSDSTPELVTRVYDLYEKLGRGDVSAVQNMDETGADNQKSDADVKPKLEAKKRVQD